MFLHVQVCCLFQTLAAISVHDFHGIATSCSLLGRGIDRGKGAPAKAQKYTGFVPKIPRIFPCFRGSLFNKSLDFRGPLFSNKSTHTKGTWTCWLSQTRPTMTNRFHLDMWMFQQWPYLPSNTPMSNSVSLLRTSGGSGNDIAERPAGDLRKHRTGIVKVQDLHVGLIPCELTIFWWKHKGRCKRKNNG